MDKTLSLILLIHNIEEQDKILALYSKYKKPLLGYAYNYLNNFTEAEDIIHNVFVKLIEKPDLLKYDDPDKNKAYVYVMVKNQCLKKIGQNKRIADEFLDEAIATNDDFFDQFSKKESFNAAVDEIMKLPDIYKDAILLKYNSNLEDEEISDILDISINVLRVRVHRALSQLKKTLKEHDLHD